MELAGYIEPFLHYCKDMRGYSDETLRSYSVALNTLLEFHEIEQREDTAVLNIMPLRLHYSKHSKKAVAARLSAVRSFIEYINNFQNVNLKLQGDQSVKVPKTLPKPIENSKIMAAIKYANTQDALIIVMLYALGLRISELTSLKLADISASWVRVMGKGSKVREVPLLEVVAKKIAAYKEQYHPKEYLFEKSGKPLTSAQLRYRVEKAFKKHGIKATPHQLRHSFATDVLGDGARISDVSELLGHSSMATTQIYTKLTNSTKLQNYLKAHPLVGGNKED
jgi:integrase/recombinase XerC